jgi:hypothetical protein
MNLWLSIILLTAPAPAIEDAKLLDPRGAAHRLDDYSDRPLLAVVFLGTECPLARLYAVRLGELAREFPDVPIVGVVSNRHDSLAEIAAYVKRHEISFPVVKDVGGKLAERLGATRTPEAFLLDQRREIVYRGLIDDQYLVGAQRTDAGRRYLAEAIAEARTAHRAGEQAPRISVPQTEPRGCFIDRERPAAKVAKTNWSDVTSIFEARCAACHRPGQAAPFSLLTYEDASGWADTIAEVVASRRMPPWHADPRHGRFANDRSLTDDERQRILDWVAGGALKGEGSGVEGNGVSTLHPPPSTLHEWMIAPDQVVTMPAPFKVPATGIVEYQTVVVDPGFTTDRWIKAAEVMPGNRAVLHHATIFLAPPDSNEPVEAGALGSFCFLAWVPGAPPTVFPQGTAKKVPAGWKFVFMLHYVTNGSPQTDQTKLGFVFADEQEVEQEVATQFLFDPDIAIQPHQRDYTVEKSWTAPRDVLLLAMFPHMHLRGRSFQYEAVYPNGASEILLMVPNYDFNWQHRYELAEPKRLPAGTTIKATARYDNSAENPVNPDPSALVRAGQQTTDEMFNAYFDIAAPKPSLAPRRKPILFAIAAIGAVWLASRFAGRRPPRAT